MHHRADHKWPPVRRKKSNARVNQISRKAFQRRQRVIVCALGGAQFERRCALAKLLESSSDAAHCANTFISRAAAREKD
jgi:hypothetical protein